MKAKIRNNAKKAAIKRGYNMYFYYDSQSGEYAFSQEARCATDWGLEILEIVTP